MICILDQGDDFIISPSNGDGEVYDKNMYTRMIKGKRAIKGRGGEGVYSFVVCLSRMAVDHASLTRRGEINW